MRAWDTEIDLSLRGWIVAGVIFGVAAVAWSAVFGSRQRGQTVRCPEDLSVIGARCCAPGQGTSGVHCVGLPESCPPPMMLVKGEHPGCVYRPGSILIEGGQVVLGPTDWDSVNVVERRTLQVRSFLMDQVEVTEHRFLECVRQGRCEKRPEAVEPGLPVTRIRHEQAAEFCAFVGGRLPTEAEWTYAASGSEARRFPWGPHGLVCRRSSYGLVNGPCAEGGGSPELVGSRPDGATPDGIFDLSGNVAEWSMTDGRANVHGGSFRSEGAYELKSWSTKPARSADDVGFRCVYPAR